jgi:hypothetical protein
MNVETEKLPTFGAYTMASKLSPIHVEHNKVLLAAPRTWSHDLLQVHTLSNLDERCVLVPVV